MAPAEASFAAPGAPSSAAGASGSAAWPGLGEQGRARGETPGVREEKWPNSAGSCTRGRGGKGMSPERHGLGMAPKPWDRGIPVWGRSSRVLQRMHGAGLWAAGLCSRVCFPGQRLSPAGSLWPGWCCPSRWGQSLFPRVCLGLVLASRPQALRGPVLQHSWLCVSAALECVPVLLSSLSCVTASLGPFATCTCFCSAAGSGSP